MKRSSPVGLMLAFAALLVAAILAGTRPLARGAPSAPGFSSEGLFDGTGNPLAMPGPGAHGLRVLSRDTLELTLVSAVTPRGGPGPWDFVRDGKTATLPDPGRFHIIASGRRVGVRQVGFRRRVLYAPMAAWDLRVASHLVLRLDAELADGSAVDVKSPGRDPVPPGVGFSATVDPLRFSPAIHVNQVGYLPGLSKKAFVGYYLGSLGELPVHSRRFRVVEADSNRPVFEGELRRRRDRGYNYTPAPYQEVFEADFSDLMRPGSYRIMVEGLGRSLPFAIDQGIAAAFVRTFALGLYHQRCGGANALPFTRFTHAACHTAKASVASDANRSVRRRLAGMSSGKHDAESGPRLDAVGASLYPFAEQGGVDVAGGHHDAGDYGKYTINSAQMIHHLVFAADAFPGAGELDNLGLPESGDGAGDLLQLARLEADFLAKMQDHDGAFYFLVHPHDRSYEEDVLPDDGDPQVLFPKNTAATAAAVAALAQLASSPAHSARYPDDAARYLAAARRGWDFLEQAWRVHGPRGAYQRVSHYGDVFGDEDEIAWAAVELYLATGEPHFHEVLLKRYDPSDPATRRWGWWRLFEGYGCALRSYAFAKSTGRAASHQLDQPFLRKAVRELLAGADDVVEDIRHNAYGTPFPGASKRFRNAGWYFSTVTAFDLLPAMLLRAQPELVDGYVGALGYEAGANPVNVSFIAGLGTLRQRELVHQYARNDRRVMPPTGIPVGNIREGFRKMGPYTRLEGSLSYPPDGDETAPYAPYDRFSDSFDTSTESASAWMARSLAGLAYLMASTQLKAQPWRATPAAVSVEERPGGGCVARIDAEGLPLGDAVVVWEAAGQEPVLSGPTHAYAVRTCPAWVEAEAQVTDGRRVFAVWQRHAARRAERQGGAGADR